MKDVINSSHDEEIAWEICGWGGGGGGKGVISLPRSYSSSRVLRINYFRHSPFSEVTLPVLYFTF